MYLKRTLNGKEIRLNLIINGIIETTAKGLELYFTVPNGIAVDDIRNMFSNISEILVYTDEPYEKIDANGAVKTVTEERIDKRYDKYTSLNKIEYDYYNDVYKVTLTEPSETEERLAEFEDALNFLLMGGE